MIGTNGMGHTFPGACWPFGIVQLSSDTDTVPHNIDGLCGNDDCGQMSAWYIFSAISLNGTRLQPGEDGVLKLTIGQILEGGTLEFEMSARH